MLSVIGVSSRTSSTLMSRPLRSSSAATASAVRAAEGSGAAAFLAAFGAAAALGFAGAFFGPALASVLVRGFGLAADLAGALAAVFAALVVGGVFIVGQSADVLGGE